MVKTSLQHLNTQGRVKSALGGDMMELVWYGGRCANELAVDDAAWGDAGWLALVDDDLAHGGWANKDEKDGDAGEECNGVVDAEEKQDVEEEVQEFELKAVEGDENREEDEYRAKEEDAAVAVAVEEDEEVDVAVAVDVDVDVDPKACLLWHILP